MNHKQIEPTRFCDLPDEILEHIFSFLHIEDLVRVGCLSKRCNKLHPPSLSLSLEESSDARISTCDRRKQLLESLKKLLIRRRCTKLQCFRFSWCYHDHDSHCPEDLNSLLVKFIDYVVRCNVEELHLKINIDYKQNANAKKFPLIRSESLRHLHVKGVYTTIATPLFSSFPNLERLELTLVGIPDEKIFTWISHSCKRIKELRLEDVYVYDYRNIESVFIDSSSLKSFTFILNKPYRNTKYNLYVTCEKLEEACIRTGEYGGALRFSAPNLKKLKWSAPLTMYQNSSKVVGLEEAEIDLDPGVNDFNKVPNLFHSIQGAKVLDITERTMKCLYQSSLTLEQLQLNVCCLRIRGLSLIDEDVPVMVYLLNRMPNLATLHIEAGRNASRYKSSSCSHRSDWEYQNLAVHNLKEVTIQLSTGDNGISFTQYVLHHALQLQKMVIYYLPEQCNEVKRYKRPRVSRANVVFRKRGDQDENTDRVFDFLDRDVARPKKILVQSYGSIVKSVFDDFGKHALSSSSC